MHRVEAALEGWAIIDGQPMPLSEATVPVTDIGFMRGFSVFDTVVASRDLAPNLERLRASGESVGIPTPSDEVLRAEIGALQERVHPDAIVRITITGDGRRVLWATAPEPGRRHRPVRCITGEHDDNPHVDGTVKHRSRLGWVAAVRRSGVDEMLLVDRDGRFTEGTTCAILAVIGGRVYTAPWDGRILESTTLRGLLADCDRLGIEVVREGAPADGPFDALYIASTTRHLAPVVELDGRPLPGWDPVGRQLAGEPAPPT